MDIRRAKPGQPLTKRHGRPLSTGKLDTTSPAPGEGGFGRSPKVKRCKPSVTHYILFLHQLMDLTYAEPPYLAKSEIKGENIGPQNLPLLSF